MYLDDILDGEPVWKLAERETLRRYPSMKELKTVGFPEKWERSHSLLVYTAGDMCISDETYRKLEDTE